MEPLVFEPYLRPMVWGKRRLGEFFGKQLPPTGTFGESWEISAHSHHVSRVAEGPLQGTLVTEVCAQRSREIFGDARPPGERFPLLLKLLDCNDLLSIQVHPSDELAVKLAPGEGGKTEAWVILHSAPEGQVYAGLKAGTTPADLERHLHEGTVDHCLHAFAPKAGDCVFLPAGTVHAVGGGVVMAEVQQTSDATFRLFDWNRLGQDGKPRPLHIRQALEAIDWKRGPVDPVTPAAIAGLAAGVRGEHLVRCRYFTLDRFYCEGVLPPPKRRLSLWMLVEGAAELQAGAYRRLFRRGATVLVPASATEPVWRPAPSATLLGIGLGTFP